MPLDKPPSLTMIVKKKPLLMITAFAYLVTVYEIHLNAAFHLIITKILGISTSSFCRRGSLRLGDLLKVLKFLM